MNKNIHFILLGFVTSFFGWYSLGILVRILFPNAGIRELGLFVAFYFLTTVSSGFYKLALLKNEDKNK